MASKSIDSQVIANCLIAFLDHDPPKRTYDLTYFHGSNESLAIYSDRVTTTSLSILL